MWNRTRVLYDYCIYFQRKNKSSTMCQCASRSKKVKCLVLVSHCGDHFQKNELLHAEVPDRGLETNISTLPFQTSDWKSNISTLPYQNQTGNEHLDAAVPDLRLETNISTLPYQTSGWKQTSPRYRSRPHAGSRTSRRCRTRHQTGNEHLDAAVPDLRLDTNISTLPYQTSD